MSQSGSSVPMPFHRRHPFFAIIVVATVLTVLSDVFSDGILLAALLFFPLVLCGALGQGREFLTPSLKELAFYSLALAVAAVIWTGVPVTASVYEASGALTLALFMGIVLVAAIALGALTAAILAGGDAED